MIMPSKVLTLCRIKLSILTVIDRLKVVVCLSLINSLFVFKKTKSG